MPNADQHSRASDTERASDAMTDDTDGNETVDDSKLRPDVTENDGDGACSEST